MKQPISLIIVFLLFIQISCQKESESAQHQNEDHSSSITQEYPINFSENWRPNASEIQGVDFVILYKDKDDDFRENINLMTEELRPGTTLGHYTKLTIDHLRKVDQKEMISQATTTINGLEAQILEFKANLTGQNLYYYQQYMVDDGTAYVLTFSSDLDDANALKPEVKEIFKTFRIPD